MLVLLRSTGTKNTSISTIIDSNRTIISCTINTKSSSNPNTITIISIDSTNHTMSSINNNSPSIITNPSINTTSRSITTNPSSITTTATQ